MVVLLSPPPLPTQSPCPLPCCLSGHQIQQFRSVANWFVFYRHFTSPCWEELLKWNADLNHFQYYLWHCNTRLCIRYINVQCKLLYSSKEDYDISFRYFLVINCLNSCCKKFKVLFLIPLSAWSSQLCLQRKNKQKHLIVILLDQDRLGEIKLLNLALHTNWHK